VNIVISYTWDNQNYVNTIQLTNSLVSVWNPGKIYTYNFDLGDNKSEMLFEVIVEPWAKGEDDGYENFREFVDEENTPERNIVYAEIKKALLESVAELAEEERALVHALYWQGLSEREYSRRSGIPQRTINHRKIYILEKIRKNKFF
jgi:RNA polymerase sigma factor (sigma-70 family)